MNDFVYICEDIKTTSPDVSPNTKLDEVTFDPKTVYILEQK